MYLSSLKKKQESVSKQHGEGGSGLGVGGSSPSPAGSPRTADKGVSDDSEMASLMKEFAAEEYKASPFLKAKKTKSESSSREEKNEGDGERFLDEVKIFLGATVKLFVTVTIIVWIYSRSYWIRSFNGELEIRI